MQLAGSYFAMQALAFVGWWAFLLARPDVQAPFFPDGIPSAAMFAFAVPDGLLVIVGSMLACVFLRRCSDLGVAFGVLAAGAVDYAALYVDAWSWIAGGGWLGELLMSTAGVASTVFAFVPAALRLRSRAAGTEG
jgi:hypothetical protein